MILTSVTQRILEPDAVQVAAEDRGGADPHASATLWWTHGPRHVEALAQVQVLVVGLRSLRRCRRWLLETRTFHFIITIISL
jgi:hypothetical protein